LHALIRKKTVTCVTRRKKSKKKFFFFPGFPLCHNKCAKISFESKRAATYLNELRVIFNPI
jgi:hypothetical protein